jgi:hypothetical protein
MATVYKLVNGVKVPLTNDEKLQRTADRAAHKAKMEAKALVQYKEDRASEYPGIGDQLDAILKQLNYQRMQGLNLIEDMDGILGLWLAVKAKFPKPE